ncbi:hypothetical protein K443DRAFT_629295 [Laccaria amethystina LaAM-08-1]|uniref:Uncharacterized protein n=1 Tax=Laccaria amethystina LaAM-08-1 TaxID=1095629 RepID=A0A0C9XPR4_9AGAR|nr:hypothetical protein K443DRAFT_629295 [Laccaria amethystina LaAM-08-1]
MPLPTGKYFIRNKAFNSFVQRAAREDHSLLPKPIVSIAHGERAYPGAIEEQYGLYTIKAGGAPAFSKNRLVFVSLLEEVDEGVKCIDNPVTKEGWVLSEDEAATQVACRFLIAGPSEPPFYPPNQLWIITPAD